MRYVESGTEPTHTTDGSASLGRDLPSLWGRCIMCRVASLAVFTGVPGRPWGVGAHDVHGFPYPARHVLDFPSLTFSTILCVFLCACSEYSPI